MVIARAIAALTILLVAGRLADAQPPPTSASSADAALAAQKAAFLALPESTRKAAQDALVWLGFYNGVVDGDFGRRTRDAILAFQASAKAPADGALSALELQALLASAQKARDAVGFRIVSDAKSGARIGAPAILLSARSGVRLEFASSADPDLSALYARLTAVTPARKIAYKAIKPDAFFVVSGQDGASNFYTRGRDRGRQFVRAVSAARNDACRQRGQRRRRACIQCGSARAQSRAGGDGARRRARQGADGAQGGRLPEPDGRRQAGTGRA
ncbi:peptidoglycan-binding domain-containing protein, partial [Roseiarcus sp.]|uniref:peptidoglycan-binding domain-containing protein n=1 Tax=Roseiarcus sp. TaxID=1969460 RepID=UPI003D0EFF24